MELNPRDPPFNFPSQRPASPPRRHSRHSYMKFASPPLPPPPSILPLASAMHWSRAARSPIPIPFSLLFSFGRCICPRRVLSPPTSSHRNTRDHLRRASWTTHPCAACPRACSPVPLSSPLAACPLAACPLGGRVRRSAPTKSRRQQSVERSTHSPNVDRTERNTDERTTPEGRMRAPLCTSRFVHPRGDSEMATGAAGRRRGELGNHHDRGVEEDMRDRARRTETGGRRRRERAAHRGHTSAHQVRHAQDTAVTQPVPPPPRPCARQLTRFSLRLLSPAPL